MFYCNLFQGFALFLTYEETYFHVGIIHFTVCMTYLLSSILFTYTVTIIIVNRVTWLLAYVNSTNDLF